MSYQIRGRAARTLARLQRGDYKVPVERTQVSEHTGRYTWRGWAAFACLWLLFDAPQLLQAGTFSVWSIRPSFDVPLLVLLYVRARRMHLGPRGARSVRFVLVAWSGLAFLYSVDASIWRYLMRSEPLVYDQVVMLRHAMVLLSDLWSWKILATVAAIGLGAALVALATLRLVRIIGAEGPGGFDGRALRTLSTLAILMGLTATFSFGLPFAPRFASGRLVVSTFESIVMMQRLDADIRANPHRKLAQVRLTRKPRIEIIFVESYGRMLWDDRKLRDAWLGRLESLRADGREGGLEVASSFSEAPVSGGRSWVAEGAVLMGTPVKHEVVFRSLVERMTEIPNLVGFLDDNGYETVLLAPADRVRLGVENENRYGYDRTVTFDDLGYKGRHVGWGLVPDQFSLAVTRQRVLDQTHGPLFFNFHMVSSHAPWDEVPSFVRESPLVDAARSGSPTPEVVRATVAERAPPVDETEEITKRLRRMKRDKDHTFAYHGELDHLGRAAYGRAIFYALEVVGDHLRRHHPDRLVLVLGDHQPPVVAEANASFQVPVHVFASDADLLSEFERNGFNRGIAPRPDSSVRHEALFSLLIRALSGCCARGALLPAVLPRGAPLGG